MSIGIERNRRAHRGLARGLGLLLILGLVAAACGKDDTSSASGTTTGAGSASADAKPSGTLRLGYFANVTHAPAIIAVQHGLFAKAEGSGVDIKYSTYNSGTEAVEALSTGSIDAAFMGPNPAINGYAASLADKQGGVLRIVAGTTSGGASLVVKKDIGDAQDLKGKTLATPSLGNTQDVALRSWLAKQGLKTDQTGGGDVKITPQDNADTLTTFEEGDIQGAWVPEPWATRLVAEGGGKVLVNEAHLWPGGKFVTTHLVVRADYLTDHPANVKALIAGLLDGIAAANADPAKAQQTVNDGIEKVTTKRLSDATIAASWKNLTFTPDPIASSLETSKDDAVKVGLLKDVDLDGIYDLTLLDQLLKQRGQPEVRGL